MRVMPGASPRRFSISYARFQVDLIVHAGDIVDQAVLDRLESVAPMIAVHGNNEPLELWKSAARADHPDRRPLDASESCMGTADRPRAKRC